MAVHLQAKFHQGFHHHPLVASQMDVFEMSWFLLRRVHLLGKVCHWVSDLALHHLDLLNTLDSLQSAKLTHKVGKQFNVRILLTKIFRNLALAYMIHVFTVHLICIDRVSPQTKPFHNFFQLIKCNFESQFVAYLVNICNKFLLLVTLRVKFVKDTHLLYKCYHTTGTRL